MANDFIEFHTLEAAAKEARGLFIPGSTSHPPLVMCLDINNGSIYAVQDACPHAGHQLSKGDQLVEDIEDLAPGCNLGTVIACPAHAFTYDMKSGYCLSNPDGGRYAERWEVRREENHLFIGEKLPRSQDVPQLTKEQSDKIQLTMVSRALDRKYSKNINAVDSCSRNMDGDFVEPVELPESTHADQQLASTDRQVAQELVSTRIDQDINEFSTLSDGLKVDEEVINQLKEGIEEDIHSIDLSSLRKMPTHSNHKTEKCNQNRGELNANDAIAQLKAEINHMNDEISADSLLLKPRSYIFESRCESANLLRLKGNEHFKRASEYEKDSDGDDGISLIESEIKAAIECYDRGLYHVDFDEAQLFDLTERHTTSLHNEKIPLHMNKALCLSKLAKLVIAKKSKKHHLKEELLSQTLKEINSVLEMDSKHVKALLLKGKTQVAVGKPENGLFSFTMALDILDEPSHNPEIDKVATSKNQTVSEVVPTTSTNIDRKEVIKLIKATQIIVKKETKDQLDREKELWKGKLSIESSDKETGLVKDGTGKPKGELLNGSELTESNSTEAPPLRLIGWLPLVLFMAMLLFKVMRGDISSKQEEL